MLVVTIICPPRDGKRRKEEIIELDELFFVHSHKICPLCGQEECKFLVATKKISPDKLSDEECLELINQFLEGGEENGHRSC